MENTKLFKTIFDFLFRMSLSLLILISSSFFLLAYHVDLISIKIIFSILGISVLSLIPHFDMSIHDLYRKERHQEWFYKITKYLILFPLLISSSAIKYATLTELYEVFLAMLYVSIAYISIVEPYKTLFLDKCNKEIIAKSKILDELGCGREKYTNENEIFEYNPNEISKISLISEYWYKTEYLEFLNFLIEEKEDL